MNQLLGRSFVCFHLTLAGVVLVQSVSTAFEAFGVEPDANWHLFILATAEALAAIMFVIPFTLRFGGIVLCLTFLGAFISHALTGEFELHLLVYVAGTVFIVFHGAGWEALAKRDACASNMLVRAAADLNAADPS